MSATWCDRNLMAVPFWYGLCASEARFQAEMDQMDVDPADRPEWVSVGSGATVHTFEWGGKLCLIVCIKGYQGRNGIEVAGLLTHEAVHIWQKVRESIGEREPSAEFEAYSIQSIAQSLMSAFVEQTTTQRKKK